jgi:hypothetical protein
MAVLVTLLACVVGLLGLLVAGLLRSHAEILRALRELDVDLDPSRVSGASGAARASGPAREPRVRSRSVEARPARLAVDVQGTTPDEDAVGIAVAGTRHQTLLAFLTSGCTTCIGFWDAFAAPRFRVPGDARLVVVTKGADAESIGNVRRLAPRDVPVVLSNEAWEHYDVPVAPFFVLVDGPSSSVIGEGAASTWEQVTSLIATALADAGLVDRDGKRRRGAVVSPRARDRRELRVDSDLLAAGIRPGDPRLYQTPDTDPHDDGVPR